MVKQSMKSKQKNFLKISLIFAGVISLYFHRSAADPFNAPKLWLLIMATAWLCGYLFIFRSKFFSVEDMNLKVLRYLLLIFLAALIWAFLSSDVKLTAFFGENMRKVGFVTYFCFGIFMYFSAKYVVISNYLNFYCYAFIVGVIFLLYGILQATGNDFVSWVNPYNAIIGTLGNPNYAAAFLAMFATIFFSFVFIQEVNRFVRIASLTLTGLTVYCIQLSDARQGILAAAVGIGFFTCAFVYFKSRVAGLTFFAISFIVSGLVILGMLQKGPLQQLIYKDSVSIRGYYWRAGIDMFLGNPLTGVGLDRYGAYFKEYQELNYGLKIGFDITSTNAHNIPIQIFATGGLFLGLSYLSLISYIFYKGFTSIKNFTGNERVFSLGIFSAWLTYQAQSVVSIENIGLGVWGWLLGGMIVGLARKSQFSIDSSKQFVSKLDVSLQPFISLLVLIPALVLVSRLVSVESIMYKAQFNYNPDSPQTNIYANQVLETQFMDNDYKYSAANMMLRANGVDQGIEALEELVNNDPRNNYYMLALAQALEFQNRISESILVRERVTVVDPHNVKNYLQLGRLYKAEGNLNLANQMRLKLILIAPNTDQAKAAQIELVSNP
jgi:O-antigen ligase